MWTKGYNIDGAESDIANGVQAIDLVTDSIRGSRKAENIRRIEIVSESNRYDGGAFPVRDYEIAVYFAEA